MTNEMMLKEAIAKYCDDHACLSELMKGAAVDIRYGSSARRAASSHGSAGTGSASPADGRKDGKVRRIAEGWYSCAGPKKPDVPIWDLRA